MFGTHGSKPHQVPRAPLGGRHQLTLPGKRRRRESNPRCAALQAAAWPFGFSVFKRANVQTRGACGPKCSRQLTSSMTRQGRRIMLRTHRRILCDNLSLTRVRPMKHLLKTIDVAIVLTLAILPCREPLRAADYPAPQAGDYILRDFQFSTRETLPELRMHYRTLGTPQRDDKGVVRNAMLIMHGTTGEGGNFLRPEFAGQLFGKGQLLDASRYYLILPDAIGHGHSSRPSDGFHARFPRYGYRDMVDADYRLLTEGLKVNHLRLVMGTSMGGMHTWLWGELHPDFMDALLPLASLPTQISGRNRIWRRTIIDSIRTDPEWKNGEYTTQPPGLRTAAFMLMFMSSNPVQRQKEMPTREKADAAIDQFIERTLPNMDANNTLYALDASSDYNPGPDLERIKAPLLAINTADDLINPPELGILEREIARVKHGKAVVIPLSDQTRGHGTHTLAVVWKNYLEELLRESQ